MALVPGKCTRCGNVIQIEDTGKVGYCAVCGTKLAIDQSVALYQQELTQPAEKPGMSFESARRKLKYDDTHVEAQEALSQGRYELAETLFGELLATQPNDIQAKWGVILAKTHNLTPKAIGDPEEYAYSGATALFESGEDGLDPEWREGYAESYEASCRMAVEAIDPRVFLELKIYQWYPGSNTYLYPISKDFDIQPILDKELWADWNKLTETLPDERREPFRELCVNCCHRIREYFNSGFTNMAELQNNDLSRLMGTWFLKHTTGTQKTEVLSFTQNAVGIAHLEAYRTTVNGYDYYRNIRLDQSSRILAEEYRHFPSATGLGGDFYVLDPNSPALGLLAVYEYVLILPTALYSRTEPVKIPNNGKALTFIEKCRAMPCFLRSDNLKNVHQMRPINENHDTGEQSKRMRHCYIATAVYGDIEAPEVRRLRRFRDEWLNRTRFGRFLCGLYYRFSPRCAEKLSPGGPVGRLIRRMLDFFVKRLGD